MRTLTRFALPVCALFIVLTFVTLTRADADLWGHVRFGADMIESAAIHVPETYSFTSDKPWINHEWLAEIVMATAYRAFGSAGLVLLKVLVVALSLACVWRIVMVDGASMRPALMLTILALGGILPRAQQVRPQLFSVLCFSVLVLLLRRAEKQPAARGLAAPLMVLWTNSHGGWVVGCGTLILWCAARTWTMGQEGSRRGAAMLWAACIASVAATLINPYGAGLWRFIASTVGLSRRFIPEWGPVTGNLTTMGVWLLFCFLVIIAVKRAAIMPPLHRLVVPVFWGLAAFKVSRLDAFFALSAIGLLAPELIRALDRRRGERVTRQPSWRAQAAAGAVAVATLALTLPQLGKNLFCIDVHASSSIPEADAIEFVRSRQLTGRMVTFFDWGQYAIWYKPGDLRVSMDGRRETVYSDRSVDLHLDMYLAMGQGLEYLETLRADYVWVPRELPLVKTLSASPAWTTMYRGGRSIIFARAGLLPPGTPVQEGAAVQCRCFPGP